MGQHACLDTEPLATGRLFFVGCNRSASTSAQSLMTYTDEATNDKEMKHWQRLVSEITGNSKSTKSGKKQRDVIKKNLAQSTNMKDAIQELQKDS